MSIWIEYRCENMAEPTAIGDFRRRCDSIDNSGPMAANEKDTRESVAETLRRLDKNALDLGWKKRKDGWVCRFCAEQIGLK